LFRDKDTEAPFNDVAVGRFRAIERQARRRLLYLHRPRVLQDLSAPPGNPPGARPTTAFAGLTDQ